MKKGEKEYFKHFSILAILVSGTIILSTLDAAPAWLLRILIIVSATYILLFSAGLYFNAGPFKYIGKLYIQDAENERNAMRTKQPWE